MTQQWKPTGGRFDVEPLENINEVADLPDLAQLDEAQIYSIRSGEFAPDYVVPWAWDATAEEYQEWRSTVDGQAIRDIPDILIPQEDDLQHFGGDTDSFDINNDSPVKEGDFSLKVTSENGSPDVMGSLSGLEHYPDVGDTHRIWYYPNDVNNSIQTFGFGHDSETSRSNGYFVILDVESDEILIERLDSGSRQLLGSESDIGYNDKEWHDIEILHESNGDLTVTVTDNEEIELASITVNDDTHITEGEYDETGIFFEGFRAEPDAYDRWRITDSGE